MPPIYKISRLGLGTHLGQVPKVRINQHSEKTTNRAKDRIVSNSESNEYSKQSMKDSRKRHLSPDSLGSVVTIKRRRMGIVGHKINDMIQNNIRIKKAEKIVKGLIKEIMELKAMNDIIRREYARIYVDLQRYESSVIVSELMAMEESIKQDTP
ncbi:UNVERIFIED_CONTAM: hypothetical protein RMT77_004677 [Armadillidium vulgare]